MKASTVLSFILGAFAGAAYVLHKEGKLSCCCCCKDDSDCPCEESAQESETKAEE